MEDNDGGKHTRDNGDALVRSRRMKMVDVVMVVVVAWMTRRMNNGRASMVDEHGALGSACLA